MLVSSLKGWSPRLLAFPPLVESFPALLQLHQVLTKKMLRNQHHCLYHQGKTSAMGGLWRLLNHVPSSPPRVFIRSALTVQTSETPLYFLSSLNMFLKIKSRAAEDISHSEHSSWATLWFSQGIPDSPAWRRAASPKSNQLLSLGVLLCWQPFCEFQWACAGNDGSDKLPPDW